MKCWQLQGRKNQSHRSLPWWPDCTLCGSDSTAADCIHYGVAGTYHGSKVADDIQNNTLTRTAFNVLGDYIIGPLIALGQFKPELEIDFDASMKSLTQTGSSSFNASVAKQMVQDGVLASTENCNKNLKSKDRNGIYYYSWTVWLKRPMHWISIPS